MVRAKEVLQGLNVLTGSREEELVRKSRDGDLDAFTELVRLYERKVFTLVYRFAGNRADAHDLAQETFLRVFQTLPSLREEKSFARWLCRVAANVCRDELRRKKKRACLSLDEMAASSGSKPLPASSADCPEASFEQGELSAAVQEVLNSLPPDHRLVLVLREIQGMSYEEIAAALEISLGTVKSKLSRARQSFREKALARGELFSPFLRHAGKEG
jgi:RNA polymerase sigma-70 factor (ECF subfamily)